MSHNCLAGCPDMLCSPLRDPKRGHNWATASPFVKIKFTMTGNEITVGNESAPFVQNKMVIKSFTYSTTNGFKVEVEIHDEEGGRFHEFIDVIAKCGPRFSENLFVMEPHWGWIMVDCDGNKAVRSTEQNGVFVKCTCVDMEVSYSEGKIKYRLTGTPVVETMNAFRQDKISGSDDKKIPITHAIRALCAVEPPITVDFYQRDRSGQIEPLVWEIGGTEGPLSTWEGDSQNKLATIARWVEPFRTKRKKGIYVTADPNSQNKIIIWEDAWPECNEDISCRGGIGTFIVNGGNCSNVIEFTPTFNWLVGIVSHSSGGETAGPVDGSIVLQEDKKPCPEDEHGKNTGRRFLASGGESGQENRDTITRPAYDVYGKEAPKENADALKRHRRANSVFEQQRLPIDAQLRILGDPIAAFCRPDFMHGNTLSIVAINPFHIGASDRNVCGDWLARPVCNQVLSNKSWLLLGAEHSIKEGFYETILKITLTPPGVIHDSGQPLGGPGSGGYVPKGTCST